MTPKSNSIYDNKKPENNHNTNDYDEDIERKLRELNENGTDWMSIYLVYVMLFFGGIQITVYFTSLWPYLLSADNQASVSILGWVVASFSIGQALGCPFFGWWSEKIRSTRIPVCCGLLFVLAGNFIYAILANFSSEKVSYIMILSRFLVGIGSGTNGVLRAYNATACIQSERRKVVALGVASMTLGATIGPVIQAIFNPFGVDGYLLFNILKLNMFTLPPLVMVVVCCLSIIFFFCSFQETFIGIEEENEKDIKSNEKMVKEHKKLPPFDKIAVAICIYNWFVIQTMATNVEVLASPLTIAMYNWSDSEAILYNGIMLGCSALINFANFLLQAFTRLRYVDVRKMIIVGISMFLLFTIINYPWPFYTEKLDYIPIAPNSTIENTQYKGGCSRKFEWCEDTPRTPIILYIISFIFCLGMGFPTISGPNGALYADILGPRRQGFMQGIMELFGSIARAIGPLSATWLFNHSGTKYCMVMQGILVSIAIILMVIFKNRLIPLQIIKK
ncbi:Major facilitator superfamily and Major facilitator superfamily domain, general substrate transporter and Major facilitator superfamily domain-containing protein [Strongyloides ratti]|uniref:Major facilitator superfamily and Major facilitator superfamily domain, general substrate transporter and Major facilitator superfamily domain-containing protein n=1 Tax=Strongyloides ratti TaxID=34506 RepID=A0A090L9Q6_STRRB|nr:Major facilitator superfamily and Major facilitator superfamily domain, general substrate transporter and Major facilitator superfamily domain-containing protein [Strongyloides ratti]CEF64200.1 Major facilitator superfamily and Major facilitator superfamily domain, general substrate transporter and Major facilitator superfamily domain-containing protein [Strongyloides ratti]